MSFGLSCVWLLAVFEPLLWDSKPAAHRSCVYALEDKDKAAEGGGYPGSRGRLGTRKPTDVLGGTGAPVLLLRLRPALLFTWLMKPMT